MDYEHFADSTCRRKVKHGSQERADAVIERLYEVGKAGDATLNAYNCIVCGEWHIGHVPLSPLDKLPRVQSYEFVGVRKDNGKMVWCKTLINAHGLTMTLPVHRNDLKGWIEEKWFADE